MMRSSLDLLLEERDEAGRRGVVHGVEEVAEVLVPSFSLVFFS